MQVLMSRASSRVVTHARLRSTTACMYVTDISLELL
jgi:hypothetical protein